MNTIEERNADIADQSPFRTVVSTTDILAILWTRRLWLAKAIGIGGLITLGIAFLIPNEYTSTAQLMPPDQQAFSTSSMLSALTGPALNISSVGSSLMNQRTPGATSLGILSSRTVQDEIINQFDLRRVYRCKLYVDARKELTKRTALDEDRKTGIVSIAVTDRDRQRAHDIAQAYIDQLDKLVNSLSTSSARRERQFLEGRLKSIKSDLDDSSRALSQFSSRNATMDPQKQGEATVEAAAKLQGVLTTAESELSGLRAMYTDDNIRVREVRARIEKLQSQLRILGGQDENADGADLKGDDLLPSVRKLPLLGFTYYSLYRQVAIDETIYEALTKQYELAKVQEAKDIPPVKVLDMPEVPEKKSYPYRSIVLAIGLLLSTFASIVWIVVSKLWNIADDSSPVKTAGRGLADFWPRRKPQQQA